MASLRSKVAEHLACAVCLEQFQNPKVLPCLHSYCHDCIMRLEKTNDNITCPECRIQVKVGNLPDISFLPSNFFVNRLLAMVSLENDARDRIICDNCDSADSAAQGRCQQCSRYLCEVCINTHKRVGDTKGHIIKKLEDLKESGPSVMTKIMYCSKHKDEIVQVYCTTCEETICRDCAIIDHREHSFVFAGEVVEGKRAELQQLVDEVKERKTNVSAAIEQVEKIEDNLAAQTQSVITEINEYFENIFKTFEKRRAEFIEEANNLELSKLKQLRDQREELEMALTSFESSIQFTEQVFENGSDVELVNMEKFIAGSLNNLKSEENDVKPCVDDHIEFIPGSTVDEMVHEGLLLCSIVGKRYDQELDAKCKLSIRAGNLSPGKEAVVRIEFPNRLKNEKARIQLLLLGVEVNARRAFFNENCVHVAAAEFGTLLVNLCVNGRCLPQTTLVKNVTWDWENDSPFTKRYIGNYVFVTGVHSWVIKLGHRVFSSACSRKRCQFTVGVIDESGDLVGLSGYVKSECEIEVNLDMTKQKLNIKASWG